MNRKSAAIFFFSAVAVVLGASSASAQSRTGYVTTRGRVVTVAGPGEAHGSTAIHPPVSRVQPRPSTSSHIEVLGRPYTHAELAQQQQNRVPAPISAQAGKLRQLSAARQELARARFQSPGQVRILERQIRTLEAEVGGVADQLSRVRAYGPLGNRLSSDQILNQELARP
jgi:hypothetical protein